MRNMRRTSVQAVVLALGLAIPGSSGAADFLDPEWPCLQRRVENMSLGLMWTQPIPDGKIPAEIRPQAIELAETLVLRRISLNEADALIEDFLRDTPGVTDAVLGQIFRIVFERINHNRSQLIGGITSYSLAQIEASDRIDKARVEMDQIMTSDAPDYDRVDSLEEQLDWQQRIYRDRAQALTYVCETPVLLEKRTFALAQALARHLQS
jgi:hypothetical protein